MDWRSAEKAQFFSGKLPFTWQNCLTQNSQKVRKEIISAVIANSSLTTSQISSGEGIEYRPSAADLLANHPGQLSSIRKQALRKSGLDSNSKYKGHMMLLETLADGQKGHKGQKVKKMAANGPIRVCVLEGLYAHLSRCWAFPCL